MIAALAAFLFLPLAAQADCVPPVQPGWVVPFTMVTLSNDSSYRAASYTTGYLTGYAQPFTFTSSWSGDKSTQLLSDRVGPGNGLVSQPFDVNQPSYIGLTVARGLIVVGGNFVYGTQITLTQDGSNTRYTFQGSCDATNLLHGVATVNAWVSMGVLITFGTPEQAK